MLNYKTGLRVSKSKNGWQDRKDKAMMMMMSQVPIQKEKNKKIIVHVSNLCEANQKSNINTICISVYKMKQ